MEKTLRKNAIKLTKETAFILLTVVCAVVLPQVLHILGDVFGLGGTLGQIFLPMYLPILIIGFYRGPISGAAAGLLAPLVSFYLTGMPQAVILPFITIELIVTGLFAGAFSKVSLPAVVRVGLVQLSAKAVRLITFAIYLYFANGIITPSKLFAGILISVPGVLLQLVIVSLLVVRKEKNANE